jgi:hypothetical protein
MNAYTPLTARAEAKVQVRVGDGPWTDALDFDPVMIPVEDFEASDVPYLTDSFDGTVIGLVSALIDADALYSEHLTDEMREYNLVWSDSGFSVKANCPVCDDVFPVAEGAPGDELNEGFDAVFCGCDAVDYDSIDSGDFV